ncbi:hypothetical protein VP01_196g6 [Puccinia sorghi]|uniref:Uncharacterized protein n=1 Tax=Puccinia sorghi TaxID=27349 RepID=A0A0L6VCC7_9BASI|nr:hypothetical protein VP01_196g6 [Puccinia sorghi]
MTEYMNIITSSLHLTGPQMRHRFDTYKGKYCKAKDFKRSTGSGIEEQEGFNLLKKKLKAICPCFDCMDALFKENPNITPMSCFDSSSGDQIFNLEMCPKDLDGIGAPVPGTHCQPPRN